MKKRIVTIALALVLLLTLAGCSGDSEKSSTKAKSGAAPDVGRELIELMAEKAGDKKYRQLMAGDIASDILDQIADGDYAKPRHIYEAVFPSDALERFLASIEDEEPEDVEEFRERLEDLPDALRDRFTNSLAAMSVNQILGTTSQQYLVAHSVLQTAECFVDRSVKSPTLLFYLYRDGNPAVVALTPGQDHAVSASAAFFPPDLLDGSNAKAIKALLQDKLGIDIDVREVE